MYGFLQMGTYLFVFSVSLSVAGVWSRVFFDVPDVHTADEPGGGGQGGVHVQWRRG